MKKWMVYAFLAIIVVIGAYLRHYNNTVWPRDGATFDEYAWTFLGLSLWERGIPTSWSPHSAYTNRVEYNNPRGAHFSLVTPYLEHPPLFGLVAGGFARLNGAKIFDDVTIQKIRPLAFLLGILAIYAVFLLASGVYGDVIGLIAAGIYAIVPSIAVGSRLVQNENFFIPLFLFVLYFAHKYIQESSGNQQSGTRNQEPGTRNLFLASLLCGLLPLAKIPWIAASLAVTGMLVYAKKWKAAFYVVVATFFCISGWFIYGYVTDATLFTNLWKLQLARYDMRFDGLFVLLRDPVIADRALVDGWIYFGWAAILFVILKDFKKHLPIILGFLSYAAVFVFAIPDEPLHGWYRYPFYPFLAVALAVFLKEHFNKRYAIMTVFFVIVGLSLLQNTWFSAFGFSYIVHRLYLVLCAIGGLPVLFPAKKIKAVSDFTNFFLIILTVLLSFWAVFLYNEQ